MCMFETALFPAFCLENRGHIHSALLPTARDTANLHPMTYSIDNNHFWCRTNEKSSLFCGVDFSNCLTRTSPRWAQQSPKNGRHFLEQMVKTWSCVHVRAQVAPLIWPTKKRIPVEPVAVFTRR